MPDVGFKATLQVNDGASQAYAPFATAVTLMLPKREGQVEDSTPLSQAHPFRVFTSKRLIDPGVLKFEGFFSKIDYNRMVALHMVTFVATGVRTSWRLTTPDPDDGGTGTGLQFTSDGILTVVDEVGLSKEGLMMMKFEVKMSGQPTITNAANNPTAPTQPAE